MVCRKVQSLLDEAVQYGRIQILEYLEKQFHPTPDHYTNSVKRTTHFIGHLPVLKWLRKRGAQVNNITLAWAAYMGRISTCRWIMSEGVTNFDQGEKIFCHR